MVGDIMRKTIFDLLDKSISFVDEYERLSSMVYKDKCINYNGDNYSYIEIFDKFLADWKYRGAMTSYYEIAENIGLVDYPSYSSEESCLYLCELILNVRSFLLYKKNIIEPTEEVFCGYHTIAVEEMPNLTLNDKLIYDNVNYVISKLGYKEIKEEEYKITLIRDNADAISTALLVEEESLASLILNYNDFKIANNVEVKRQIIFNIGKYFEPKRNKLKEINSKLETNIFMALNNFHIRHNNISGKDKIAYIAKLSDEEFLDLYDKTYHLLLLAFRLIQLPNIIKEFEDIRQGKLSQKEESPF